jgi:hypothetical protein
MFESIFKKLEKEVSGENAKSYNVDIAQHHRVQASPGSRRAADYCVNAFKAGGLMDAARIDYPATELAKYGCFKVFQEWEIEEAELSVSSPSWARRRINRFIDCPMFVIERCPPTPPGGVEAEVVVLEDGTKPEDYEGKDVEGKFVLSDAGPFLDSDIERVREIAVERHGAIGILSDMWPGRVNMTRRLGFYNALVLNRFWWMENWKKCLGFMLTPNQGDELRKTVRKAEERGEKVKLHAFVKSRFYDGFFENVTATIKGSSLSHREVLITAHACHSKQSANDNASGPAACLEAARAIQKLVDAGVLEQPRRTIRFLLPPEATGDHAFIESNWENIRNTVAGLNVNMVGVDPCLGKNPLTVSKSPPSMAIFGNTLAEQILKRMVRAYPPFWWSVSEIGMSGEQEVFNDPLIGVGMPHIHHSDAYWHLSTDSINNISEEEMRKASLFTAAYAYFVANAGLREALWLAGEIASEAKRKMVEESERFLAKALDSTPAEMAASIDELGGKMTFLADRYSASIDSLDRLLSDEEAKDASPYMKDLKGELEEAGRAEHDRAKDVANRVAEASGQKIKPYKRTLTEAERKASKMVVKRLFKGGPVPIYSREKSYMDVDQLDAFDELKRSKKTPGRTDEILATYWLNGERNLLEVCELVRNETDEVDVDYLVRYFPFMSRFGWFEVTRA